MQLKLAIEARHPDYPADGTIMTDMERAVMNAFRAVFLEKAQSVCFFHFCHAVWKKTKETELQTAYGEDAELALKVRNVLQQH